MKFTIPIAVLSVVFAVVFSVTSNPSLAQFGGGNAECGNGECERDWGENLNTCFEDCFECDGDNVCEAYLAETIYNCPEDCSNVACNNNGICEGWNGEAYPDCPDCPPPPPFQGCDDDGFCDWDAGESVDNCENDCGNQTICNEDGVCDGNEDENCTDCLTEEEGCGDGYCAFDENFVTCFEDCEGTSVCGDGDCEASHEDENTCFADCGTYCGDGWCQPGVEDEQTCESDCAGGERSNRQGDGNGEDTFNPCAADDVIDNDVPALDLENAGKNILEPAMDPPKENAVPALSLKSGLQPSHPAAPQGERSIMCRLLPWLGC